MPNTATQLSVSYLATATYTCGAYGAGAYSNSTCDTNTGTNSTSDKNSTNNPTVNNAQNGNGNNTVHPATEAPTSPGTQAASSHGIDWTIPLALGGAILIAFIILLVKRLKRREKSARTNL